MTGADWFDAEVLSHDAGGFVDHGAGFTIRDVSTVRLSSPDGTSRDVRVVFDARPDERAGPADHGEPHGPDLLRRPGTRVAVALDPAVADLDVVGAGAIVDVGEPLGPPTDPATGPPDDPGGVGGAP